MKINEINVIHKLTEDNLPYKIRIISPNYIIPLKTSCELSIVLVHANKYLQYVLKNTTFGLPWVLILVTCKNIVPMRKINVSGKRLV
mgnify:CR=1 FL=1